MTTTGPLQILIGVDEPMVSSLLADCPGVEIISHETLGTADTDETDPGRNTQKIAATLDALDPDCLLVTGPDSLDVAVVEAVRARGIPVVAYTDAAIDRLTTCEHISGYVRRDDGGADDRRRLLDELAWVTSQETRQQLRDSTDQVTMLHDATAELVGAETPEELYQSTVDVAANVLDFDTCYVGIVDGEYIVPKAVSTGTPDSGVRRMRIDEGLAGKTYQTKTSQLVHHIEEDSDAKPAQPSYRSGISVPIGSHGVFQAVSTHPDAFDERDQQLAELLIGHVAEILTRLRAESVVQTRQTKITRLHEGAMDLVAARSRAELFERTVIVAKTILDFDRTYIFAASGGEFVPVAKSAPPDAVDVGRLPLDYGAVGKTYRTGESRLTPDIHADADADPVGDIYGSGISVRIDDVGVFQAAARDTRQFDETDLELAELLISHVTATLKRIEAESGLRDERDRLSALFENIPDAAVTFEFDDDRPVVQRVNTMFEYVFGYPADEIVGANIDEYVVPPANDAEATTFNEKLQQGTSLRTSVRRQTATGVRDFLLHVVPVHLDQTNTGGYAIYTDVTERRERERELRRQNERLDEFASIVSHDLRNPLTVATGYLGLVQETVDDPNLEPIDDALDQMGRLIDDLLTLARKGQVVGETTTVDLQTATMDAWSHVETNDVELVVSLSEGSTVDADYNRLVDLLQNLFRNAVEHGSTSNRTNRTESGDAVEHGSTADDDPETAKTTTVRVENTADGFAVEDDGPGIPAADRESVFETGYSTSTDGTGFGLAIVRRIAEAHDWEVTVDTGSEGGARFEFSV
ncbi:GAF domain-containing protein [Halogranum rubrum]|uniref:histidine kinase n=1 Tax=Halogranum salarium B-1 TaxID=1210908 RepID=J3JG03_9EURY|nr:GAF domain-containing protein [Halogranum salarium]EJN59666.1 hypothetical protein HSB1_18240 [Halogranum salarium B-1]